MSVGRTETDSGDPLQFKMSEK